MNNIFRNAVGWKANRVLYTLSKEDQKEKFQNFMKLYLTQEELNTYSKELLNSKVWRTLIEKKVDTLAHSKGGLLTLYALVRKLKPEVMLETGVERGCTTTIFLYALHMNQKGKLISIDYCGQHPTWVGMYVPEDLKYRWQFIKGKTCNILPTIKDKVDIFFHDSEHTYDNMYYEYQWANKNVVDKGLILSHDIGANNAFFDFAHNYGYEYYFINSFSPGGYGSGAIVKTNVKQLDNIERKDIVFEKILCPGFGRDDFTFGMNFVKRMCSEIPGLTFKMCPVRNLKTSSIKEEPDLIYNGSKICRIAPRTHCRFGGSISSKPYNKVFKVITEEEEIQLINEIKNKVKELTKITVGDYF